MNEHDFEVTVSVKEGQYCLNASGNTVDAVKGLLLAVASLIEKSKDDNISDTEIEVAIFTEFKNALGFVRENIEDADVIAEFE